MFYNRMRQNGVYLSGANNYFYQGSQVTGMGYNEQQFSLPRWRDLTISRQSLYDDTYNFRPTQGKSLLDVTAHARAPPPPSLSLSHIISRIVELFHAKLPRGSMYLSHELRGMTHEGSGTHYTIR